MTFKSFQVFQYRNQMRTCSVIYDLNRARFYLFEIYFHSIFTLKNLRDIRVLVRSTKPHESMTFKLNFSITSQRKNQMKIDSCREESDLFKYLSI